MASIKKHCKKLLAALIIAAAFRIPAYPQDGQELDLQERFKDDYTKAVAFSDELYSFLKNISPEKKSNFSDDFIVALVFPELIRYSQVQDRAEVFVNQLRARFFNSWDGFSIGHMQMKPSFAILTEEYFLRNNDLIFLFPTINFYGRNELEKDKFDRLDRLTDMETQLEYLLAFIKIISAEYEDDFEKNNLTSEEQKLPFYAKTYNLGYGYTYEEIVSSVNKKWNYEEVSCAWYDETKSGGAKIK